MGDETILAALLLVNPQLLITVPVAHDPAEPQLFAYQTGFSCLLRGSAAHAEPMIHSAYMG